MASTGKRRLPKEAENIVGELMPEEKKSDFNFFAPELTEEQKQKILNNNGLSADNLIIPKVYQEIFLDNYKQFCLSSGRISGKTCILVAIWWTYHNKYPERDIVILQATTTEIKISIINEIKQFLSSSGFDVGDDPACEYYIPRSNDTIVTRNHKGKTLIFPITDSGGGQRSRGIKTENKLSLVLYEEAQKNKDANVLEQSVITFIRQMDDMAKLVIVGNNETAGHWFVDYVEDKKKSPEWCVIYANCFDIWALLSEKTRKYIEDTRKNNPIEFRRVFLGDIHASSSDVVFPQFDKEKHYLRSFEMESHYIEALIIGVDHATADDTFAIVPVAILDNGTAQTLEVCYDDPKITQRTLAPSEQCEMLEEFVNFLDDKYGIEYNQLQTVISVDGAAAPFIAQLRHLRVTAERKPLWRNIKIKGFTLKKKDVNLGLIKNAFAYNTLVIMNEGLYDWKGRRNAHRLEREILKQRYKNGKLDPSIPNDLCDALEYGIVPYYTNCYNMSFPFRQAKINAHYDDIRRMAGLIK